MKKRQPVLFFKRVYKPCLAPAHFAVSHRYSPENQEGRCELRTCQKKRGTKTKTMNGLLNPGKCLRRKDLFWGLKQWQIRIFKECAEERQEMKKRHKILLAPLNDAKDSAIKNLQTQRSVDGEKLKSEKEAAARSLQMAAAQGQGEPPTVAQQREQEVMGLTQQEVARSVHPSLTRF